MSPRRCCRRTGYGIKCWRKPVLIRRIFPDADGASAIHTVTACSGTARLPCAGADWLAVGDAAHYYDPLCGQGIAKALTSALRGADTILTSLRQNCTTVDAFVLRQMANTQTIRPATSHIISVSNAGRRTSSGSVEA